MAIQQTKAGLNFFRQHLLDLFLPRVCCGCGQAGAHLCDSCRLSLPTASAFFCPRCLASSYQGLPCAACARRSALDRLLVACHYRPGPVRRAIEAFKYHGVLELAEPLAELMARYVRHVEASIGLRLSVDLVVAVPLHRRRHLWRGYNQAEMLADIMAARLAWPVSREALRRIRWTAPQVGRGRFTRGSNVVGAFTAAPLVRDRHILLIDDVITTGSTLRSCAQALKDKGARTVTAFALAHG